MDKGGSYECPMGRPPCPSYEGRSVSVKASLPGKHHVTGDQMTFHGDFIHSKKFSLKATLNIFSLRLKAWQMILSATALRVWLPGFCPMRAQGQCRLIEQEAHPMRELRHYPAAEESWCCRVWVKVQLMNSRSFYFRSDAQTQGGREVHGFISGEHPAHCGAAITQTVSPSNLWVISAPLSDSSESPLCIERWENEAHVIQNETHHSCSVSNTVFIFLLLEAKKLLAGISGS